MKKINEMSQLNTNADIENYFKSFKRVIDIDICDNAPGDNTIKIVIKSWIPLSRRQINLLKEAKPANIQVNIDNISVVDIKSNRIISI